eukprot:GHVO01065595.1.p2 GENE.GHVO01065595.1~~GHVO01065595.1.p2  ORF type:complete len:178 (+),score=34.78 GHVO01065595.1:344-877(+)
MMEFSSCMNTPLPLVLLPGRTAQGVCSTQSCVYAAMGDRVCPNSPIHEAHMEHHSGEGECHVISRASKRGGGKNKNIPTPPPVHDHNTTNLVIRKKVTGGAIWSEKAPPLRRTSSCSSSPVSSDIETCRRRASFSYALPSGIVSIPFLSPLSKISVQHITEAFYSMHSNHRAVGTTV